MSAKNRGVEGHRNFVAGFGERDQFVVGNHPVFERFPRSRARALGFGEKLDERTADQLLSVVTSEFCGLLVDVGNDSVRIDREQSLDR